MDAKRSPILPVRRITFIARYASDHTQKTKTKMSTIQRIQSAVIETTGLTWDDIASPSMRDQLFEARQVFTYLCVSVFAISIQDVAAALYRDRSTMVKNLKRFEDLLSVKDQQAADMVANVLARIEEPSFSVKVGNMYVAAYNGDAQAISLSKTPQLFTGKEILSLTADLPNFEIGDPVVNEIMQPDIKCDHHYKFYCHTHKGRVEKCTKCGDTQHD